MAPVATTFFFYFLSALALAGGVFVITRRNPVHSALALIVTLLALAGIYLMLYAPFVAGVQIILYAGGIMVLFLFVIMLVDVGRAEKERQFNRQWVVAIVSATGLGVLFVKVFANSKIMAQLMNKPLPTLAESNNTQIVGQGLYGNYMLAFEVASLLLLVAIIGAVVMAKKKI
jgi:NADH-quinone oxidoreductase subunit J